MSEVNGPTLVQELAAAVLAVGSAEAVAAAGTAGVVFDCALPRSAGAGLRGTGLGALLISASLASTIGGGRTTSERARSMSPVLLSMSAAHAKYSAFSRIKAKQKVRIGRLTLSTKDDYLDSRIDRLSCGDLTRELSPGNHFAFLPLLALPQ
jgi:hypothetical protein